jgi:Zn finger protein HypA/HybF involved in hydrogenase expression
MIDDYIPIPVDEKGRPLIPPIFKDKEREAHKELMKKVKEELREKGYKVFRISRSYLDLFAIKQNEVVFVKVGDNKKVDEEKLRFFAEKFNTEILIFTSNGKKRITLERKKYLTMKCECGHKTKFFFHRPLICSNCKKPFRHHCLWCGKEFQINSDTEWCSKCAWYKCPDGHCGCLLKPALAILSLRKRGLELSRFNKRKKRSYKITPIGIIKNG